MARADTLAVPSDYPDLRAAVAAAAPGDTILASPGGYDGALELVRDVTLRADGDPGSVVVTASALAPGEAVIHVGAGATVTVDGLAVDGSGTHRALRVDAGAFATVTALSLAHPATGAGDGGAVVVEQATLDLRDAQLLEPPVGFTRGGYVAVDGGTLTVRGGRFVDGTAVDGDGGALFAQGSVLTVDGASFEGCTAAEAGGAVSFVLGAKLEVRDSTFEGTRSGTSGDPSTGLGGAIFALSSTEIVVTGSTFRDGRASAGGAIALAEVDRVTLEGLRVEGCHADLGGGALAIDASTSLDLDRSVFTGNDTAGAGGALLVSGAGTPEVRGAAFCGNTAGAGTAVAVNVPGTTVQVAQSVLVGGAASAVSGAALLLHDDVLDVEGPSVLDPGDLGTIELRDSVVAGGAGAVSSGRGTVVATAEDVFWQVADPPAGGTVADPLLGRAAGACFGDLHPLPGSPLVDTASDTDLDGSPGDVGALGGPDGDALDADLDGVPALVDCDDDDALVGTCAGDSGDTGGTTTPTTDTTDAPPPATDVGDGGCGCASSGATPGGALVALLGLYARTRRARARISSVAPCRSASSAARIHMPFRTWRHTTKPG